MIIKRVKNKITKFYEVIAENGKKYFVNENELIETTNTSTILICIQYFRNKIYNFFNIRSNSTKNKKDKRY